jgi:hypothetical protein
MLILGDIIFSRLKDQSLPLHYYKKAYSRLVIGNEKIKNKYSQS